MDNIGVWIHKYLYNLDMSEESPSKNKGIDKKFFKLSTTSSLPLVLVSNFWRANIHMISLSRHFNKFLKRETPKIQFKIKKKKVTIEN